MTLLFGLQVVKQGRGSYRSYSADNLIKAYDAVMQIGVLIERVAKTFAVPISTLKDRVKGRIHVDIVKSGPQPLFSLDQERLLADHLSTMAEVGYGYSRQETLNLASDYAVHLGLRDRNKPLSLQWLKTSLVVGLI